MTSAVIKALFYRLVRKIAALFGLIKNLSCCVKSYEKDNNILLNNKENLTNSGKPQTILPFLHKNIGIYV